VFVAAMAACSAKAAGTLGTGTGEAPPPEAAAAQPADGCSDPALDHEPGCQGALCGRAERVRLTCGLREALQSRYVFYNRKPKLLAAEGSPPFDTARHLDACVLAEREIVREDDPSRFVDRLRRCLAGFEDGHLFLSMPHPLPAVSLGIRLRRTDDGKVYVAYRDPGVARWLEESGRSLEVGDEVLAVDGRPVAEALAELARLVPASSRGARLERAVDALGRRDFAFPEQRQATLTVSSGDEAREVTLPWFVSPGATSSPLAAPHLKATGLTTSDRIDWRPDSRGAWFRDGSAEGRLRGDPVVAPADAARLAVYRGDGGQLAVRLGEAAADGPPVCYAQILSFHTENLSAGGHTRPFVDVLREFLEGCRKRHLDLILDLRQNEGGYLSHSSSLAAMLTPRETISPGGALLLRATAQNEHVYRERSPMLGTSGAAAPGAAPSEPEQILMAIRDARRAKSEFTPAFLEAPLSSDGSLGFQGRVVALTSPGCMSACDRLAAMLQRGHRAVLVGGPTEGAGASQQESKDQTARWLDASGTVGVSIPNAAMGVQVAAATGATRATVDQFFEQLAFENRPVEPDRNYGTTRQDLLDGNAGWLRAARAALGEAEPASLPEPASDLAAARR
jgi:hypothetical protein